MIRVHKLMSGPGYNNHAIAAEAEVPEGADPVVVREELTAWVDAQLRGAREVDDLREVLQAYREQVRSLERTRDGLRADVDRGRAILKNHTKLREHAEANGMDVGELGELLPF
jgi:hypothetical protein